ncbi:MAG: InlB B-repeat-containing protein, partial [Bacilli bacterium]|nr:InlB B-repeat-containing protein [Bacilli bacterium]
GYYQVELWGASGDNHRNDWIEEHQAYAGYTSGKIKLEKGENLYVYVGGQNKRFNSSMATSCGISGGATDIRLISGTNWYDLDSLSSRIMVAAGAGQNYVDHYASPADGAGGLHSYGVDAENWNVNITTQTSGGDGAICRTGSYYTYDGEKGMFGIGGTAVNQNTTEGVVNGASYYSGAGGYYGGGGGATGGSGSSFISGHNGCVAITAESDTTPRNDSGGNQCSDGTTDITCSYHYSNYVFTDTKMIDGKGYEWTTEVGTEVVGMPTHDGTSTMTGNDGDGFAKITFLEEIPEYSFDYTGDVQTFDAPYNGIYKVELWGAQGSNRGKTGVYPGKGAYTSGYLEMKKNQKYYIYVGEQKNSGNSSSFNGSISSSGNGGPGGGATDIRLTKGENWNDFTSLKTRIIVAGGGGADTNSANESGAAGGLVGYQSSNYSNICSTAGTQISGGADLCESYTPRSIGSFGMGSPSGSAGGSGYFGGGGGLYVRGAGQGGSSYISGHSGCVSITKESTQDNITFVNDSNGVACNDETSTGYNSLGYNTDSSCNKHYSGYTFTDTVMIDGKGYSWDENGVGSEVVGMPSHDGRSTMIGNTGNGYAKITLIEKIDTYKINYDLDGGTLKKKKNTYSTFDTDFELENPTKEGYEFTGWTVGKNLYNPQYLKTNGKNLEDKSRKDAGFYRVLIDVKPNTDYTLSTNLPLRSDGGVFVLIKSDDDPESEIYSWNDGVYLENPRTVTSTENGHIVLAFNLSGINNLINNPNLYWAQLEEGDRVTPYESYISTPTKNITISHYSKGNRTYVANWIKNYDIVYKLDGGTISNQPISYNIETETFTLPTPTKEGTHLLDGPEEKICFILRYYRILQKGLQRQY